MKTDLSRKFDTKDLGELSYFLGMKIGSVWIGQRAYTENMLKNVGLEDCKPVSTPVDISSKLTHATDEDDCVDQHAYQSAIGSLMYLSVSTRPEISFEVSSLATFSSKPHERALDCSETPAQIPERYYDVWHFVHERRSKRMYRVQ